MIKQHRCYSLVLYFYLLIISLNAQTVEPVFDTFPASIVHAFHQDAQGFIWIGTQEGLLRFDGYSYKYYSHIPFDSTSLSNNWILDIEDDQQGNLWIATLGGGLNYFNQKTEQFRRFSGSDDGDKINFISKIVVNDNKSVWFTSTTHGLICLKLDDKKQPSYKHYLFVDEDKTQNKTRKNSALTLYKDKKGIIWVGMAKEGLIRFDPISGNFRQFKNDMENSNTISHNTVSAICEDDQGNLWIGTGHPNVSEWGGGLNMYDQKSDSFRHFRVDFSGGNSICSNDISSLLIDRSGMLWIGSWNNYLCTVSLADIQKNEHPVFTKNKDLHRPHILTLYEDRAGNIWIGMLAMHSQKLNPKQNPFNLFSRNENYPNSLTSSGTWIVYADRSGRIWFANNGLDVYDPRTGKFQHYYSDENDPNTLGENMIHGIQEDANGQIWIATWHKGIDILNPVKGTFRHLRKNQSDSTGLHSNTIQHILQHSDNSIWIASEGGVIQLYEDDSGTFHTYDLGPESRSNFLITSLYEDRKGVLWIGTSGSGIYALRLDEKPAANVVHYLNEPDNPFSLSCNAITDIIQPSVVVTGALWICTSTGLNRLDLRDGTFRHFYREDGLSSNFVLKILEDGDGDLWCSTTNGLSVYRIKTGKIQTFGEGDGLPFTSFGASRQCATKDPEGRLYFAGGDGVLSFHPEEIYNNLMIPPVRLTGFKIFQKNVKLDTAIQFKRTITLDYDQNMFSFDFAALNFINAEKNQYKYKMYGFNDNWIDIGSTRTATFTNFDPGEYTFFVTGSNNHGVWNEEGTSINIIILPPWWQTWWFRVLISIVIISIIYVFYKYRLNRLLQLERMRVQIASDLHDDIGASLTRIAVHSEIIQSTKKDSEIRKSSGRIGSMSREIITTLSDIVWSIDARNDLVGDLLDRMRDFLDTVFPSGEIKIDFQTQGLHFDQKISQDMRQNIYLIFKEAVNNAARHSGGSEIAIRLTNGTGTFHMEISDNGSGFDLQNTTPGHHGLENMRMRAERIGGTLNIEINQGTRITLKTRAI